MKSSIGLKGVLGNYKGASLRVCLRELYWQIRYAWQRAWIGYDSTDVFELGFNFVERMQFLLREFKEYNDALFPNLDKNDGSSLTEEETDAVLDEMIFYFENCNKDHVYERLYGISFYDDESEDKFDKYNLTYGEMIRCWNEAMRLFSKWSMCLWY